MWPSEKNLWLSIKICMWSYQKKNNTRTSTKSMFSMPGQYKEVQYKRVLLSGKRKMCVGCWRGVRRPAEECRISELKESDVATARACIEEGNIRCWRGKMETEMLQFIAFIASTSSRNIMCFRSDLFAALAPKFESGGLNFPPRVSKSPDYFPTIDFFFFFF